MILHCLQSMKTHKSRTLKSAINALPEKFVKYCESLNPYEVIYEEPAWVNGFYSLPYSEKMKLVGKSYTYYSGIRKGDSLRLYYVMRNVSRSGRRIFIQTRSSPILSIINNKIYDYEPARCNGYLKDILKIFGCSLSINSYQDYNPMSAVNKNILKGILCNTIYNEETLYKRIARVKFGLRDFEWKEIRWVMSHSRCLWGFSFMDLRDFTIDFNNSLRVLRSLVESSQYNQLRLFRDTLSLATQLDEKINFNWSYKRLESEHKRQVAKLTKKELESVEEVKMFDKEGIELPPDWILLDSEKEVFLEAEKMHNCLYKSYYESIKSGRYLAFHYKTDESDDITIGLWFDSHVNTMTLDQAYGVSNKKISEDLHKQFTEQVSKFQDSFLSLKEQRKNLIKPSSKPKRDVVVLPNNEMPEYDCIERDVVVLPNDEMLAYDYLPF